MTTAHPEHPASFREPDYTRVITRIARSTGYHNLALKRHIRFNCSLLFQPSLERQADYRL
jgi:hypothetical protein